MTERPSQVTSFDPYVELRRRLLTPQRVRELSQLRPARAAVDAMGCWLTIVAAWVAVALWPHWWSVALAIPVIGTSYYGLFIIGHDGLHRRVFANADHNDLFCDLVIYGSIGAITRLNNSNHIAHHKHLATTADPDRHKHCSYNKQRPLQVFGYLSGVTSILSSVLNVFGRREPVAKTQAKRAGGYTARDLAIIVGWQLTLIVGLSWAIGIWAWPVLWALPVYMFAYLGDNARAFAEHSQPAGDADADRHRLITFTSNPIERRFFAPMHMNFHAAHHLWPSIPYYNLPQAERELRQLPASELIETRGSYVAYIFRYLKSLPIERLENPLRT